MSDGCERPDCAAALVEATSRVELLRAALTDARNVAEDLRERVRDLNEVNAFLEVVLASYHDAVVVLDRAGVIRLWNRRAETLLQVPATLAEGERLVDLDMDVPFAKLDLAVEACLAGERPAAELLPARARAGLTYRVDCAPLCAPPGGVQGVLVRMHKLATAPR